LREALKISTSICWSNFSDTQEVFLTEALALSHDDTALREYGAKLVERMRKIVEAAYPTESTSAGLALMLFEELNGIEDQI
jgi:hypothetical protein